MNKIRATTISTAQGGTKGAAGFDNVNTELNALLGYVNALYSQSAGTSPPAGAQVNDLWLDTSGAEPILKRLATAPATWVPLQSSTLFSSGLAIDAPFHEFRKNMIMVRTNDSTITIPASNDAPATIGVGTYLLQNTGDTSISFSAAAAGLWYVYAEKSGSSNWSLGRTQTRASAIQTSPARSLVGLVTYGPSGATPVDKIRSYESLEGDVPRGLRARPRGRFHFNVGQATSNITDNTTIDVPYDNVVEDLWNTHDDSEGPESFLCPRSGLWRITVSTFARFSASAANVIVETVLYKRGSPNVLLRRFASREGTLTANLHDRRVYHEFTSEVELAFGDKLLTTVYQNNNNTTPATANLYNVDDYTIYATALRGEFLGSDNE